MGDFQVLFVDDEADFRETLIKRMQKRHVAATGVGSGEEALAWLKQQAADVVVPMSRNLSLIQLTERTCKWPNGDPLSDDFSFCGNEAGESGPYCGYHSRVAYQPASDRRRAR